MKLLLRMSLIAVNQVLGDRGTPLAVFLDGWMGEHSGRAADALHRASDRAWRSLEVAAGGESWWRSCAGMLAPADEKALERRVRGFLKSVPTTSLPGDPEAFRKGVRSDIQSARRVGLIPGDKPSGEDFAALGSAARQADSGRRALDGLPDALAREGYGRLATYVGLRPAGGEPLLASAVGFFFRREVEDDPRLAAGLTADRLEGLTALQRDGFEQLHRALTDHGERLESLMTEAVGLARETRDGVDALREQVEELKGLIRALTAQRGPAEQIEQVATRLADAEKALKAAPPGKLISDLFGAPAPARPQPPGPQKKDDQLISDLFRPKSP